MSKTWKERFADPKYKARICGRVCFEETRKKISEAQKGKIVSEETKQRLRESHLGQVCTDETKQKMSKAGMGRKPSDETRQKLREANSGKTLSVEHKIKLSLAHLGKVVTEETKRKIGETGKKNFQDPEYCRKMRKAWNIKPNKPETFLMELLDNLYPNEWKYTGDFSFVINGKNPDFVCCNGQKKVIELFGDYWHRGEDPKEREAVFAPFGYKTLIIWEHELKNMASVMNKIGGFCEQ